MFGTAHVLVIVRANDFDRYEALSRIHDGDGRVRVILDRRRGMPAQKRAAAPEPEARPPERRSRGTQLWKEGYLVIETGYS